jgi:hypothetical protein
MLECLEKAFAERWTTESLRLHLAQTTGTEFKIGPALYQRRPNGPRGGWEVYEPRATGPWALVGCYATLEDAHSWLCRRAREEAKATAAAQGGGDPSAR